MADLIERSQFAVYGSTVPAGMDVGSYIAGAREVFEKINKAEAVDAVPVVRCKDCAFATKQETFGPGIVFCNENYRPYPLNGFCSKGTKEGDEEDDD